MYWNKIILIFFLISKSVTGASQSEFYTPKGDLNGLKEQDATLSGLPNVLLIGDSISIAYTQSVAELLNGVADVQRVKENCGNTDRGLQKLNSWLGDTKWDVIHFNWGLHDFCYRHPDSKVYGSRDKVNGRIAVPIERYEKNLEQLVIQLKKSGASLIWASTTRVPEDEAGRFVGDELKYNAVAEKIMRKYGVLINDLYALSDSFLPTLSALPGDVHFSKEGSQLLAKQVAAAVKKTLLLRSPTLADIRYGNHERNIMDVWLAKSNSPTPLVLVIHGGGWSSGRKEWVDRFVDVEALLQAGISVAAINYRYITQAGGMSPPVKAPLLDAARALQFIRAHSAEWHLDSARIGAAGASAGACSSLWLAYHDDLAAPECEDAVSRESTRLWCAAVINAQTSLDPKQMKAWTPNSRYGGHAFGIKNFAEFLGERDRIIAWIEEYSPYANVSADDPPVYLLYKNPPALGRDQRDPTHTANFGVKLKEHCETMRVPCELVYPGLENLNYKSPTDYLITTLKK
ncbi:alpha/beta hydrolase fold domain-containing protein [Coraliomargarita sp. W4R53]